MRMKMNNRTHYVFQPRIKVSIKLPVYCTN